MIIIDEANYINAVETVESFIIKIRAIFIMHTTVDALSRINNRLVY